MVFTKGDPNISHAGRNALGYQLSAKVKKVYLDNWEHLEEGIKKLIIQNPAKAIQVLSYFIPRHIDHDNHNQLINIQINKTYKEAQIGTNVQTDGVLRPSIR